MRIIEVQFFKYTRMLISWVLSLIVKKGIFWSRKIFLAILRLFRRHEVTSGGKERAFRNHSLALSTQPSNQEQLPAFVAVSLAVPLGSRASKVELSTQLSTSRIVDGRSELNGQVSCTQHPYDVTLGAMPEPSVIPSQSAEPEEYSDITLKPIVPAEIKRYDRNVTIPCQYMKFNIKKGLLSYVEELPSAWQTFTHPEGALFFYHPDTRVFTDADVRKPEIATRASRAAEKAHQEARKANVIPSPLVELGLEIMDDSGISWGYYFADCDSRVVFWFEDNESDCLMNNVRGVEHISHVGYAIESQYWKHIELFPNKRFLPKVEVVRLKEIVMHALGDNITSDTSLAPFTPDAIVNMFTLMDPLLSNINEERAHSVCIVARFMKLFCDSKFIHFCGQPGARLDADRPLYEDPGIRPKSKTYRFMNTVLFGSPDAHSNALHSIWVDKIILQPRWKNFIDRLNNEWNGYTIFSTVMLAVDISFLAVPNVQNQTAAILISYLSTLCAMGSLMISLVLAGQVNDIRRNNAEDVASFMHHMTKFGLQNLAVMLSVPFALLIWGMLFFGIALCVLIFRTSGTATIAVTSPILVAVISLIAWPVLNAHNIHLGALKSRLLAGLVTTHEPRTVGTASVLPT